MPSQHSLIFSPSAAHRIVPCPGSVRAEREFLERHPLTETENKAALEGTAGHEIAEKMLNDLTYNGEDVIEDPPPDIPSSNILEIVNACMRYREYVLMIKNRMEEEGDKVSIVVEERYHIPTIHDQAFGTSDCTLIGIRSGIVHTIDLKLGRGVAVFAEENMQGMSYAEGARRWVEKTGVSVTKNIIHIYQPLLREGENVSSWTCPPARLEKFIKGARAAAGMIAQNTTIRNAGDSQCAWCIAEPECDDRKNQLAALFGDLLMDDDDFVDTVEGAQEALDAVEDPDQINFEMTMQAAVALKAFAKKVDALAYSMAMSGKKVPGHKLVEGRASYKCIEPMAIEVELGDKAFKPKELVSMSEVKRLMGTKSFGALAAEFYERTPGKPTLVPESDKRSEWEGQTDDQMYLDLLE